jgi:hypothetical protein
MKNIIKKIEGEQKNLENCHFLQWLGNSKISPDERLNFIPSMYFFIMGFKDLLTSIHIEKPQNELEHLISTHCEEDLGHWKWYLADLKALGYKSWGEDLMKFSTQLWSDETEAARQLVYKSFDYHYNNKSKVLDLVLIEIMEATFGAFTKSMEKCVKEAGRFENLIFFGSIHQEAEANHSAGTWVETDSVEDAVLKFELTKDERLRAEKMTAELFELFEQMFSMWYENRNSYLPVNRTNVQEQSPETSEVRI